MKKVIAAILASATLLCFTSCGTAVCSFCDEEKSKKDMRELTEVEGYICEDCADFFAADLDD